MKARLVAALSLCAAVSVLSAAQPSRFMFVSWGDTKDGLDVLASQSRQIKSMNPALTIYCGDLRSRLSIPGLNRWKLSLNAGPGPSLVTKTFAVRGNHDKGDKAAWQASFDFGLVASTIGASSFRSLSDDLTYSFDYGNAHFVGVDVPGDVTEMTARQIEWLDGDLTAAERRGLTHAFIFWHGPLYPVGGHCCSAARPEFLVMASRHPIVSATFHGHEHSMAWVHIDKNRYPQAARSFEQFVTGSSGARTHGCRPGRSDYCQRATGFAAVTVSGDTFTVNFFLDGKTQPAWTRTFTKRPGQATTTR